MYVLAARCSFPSPASLHDQAIHSCSPACCVCQPPFPSSRPPPAAAAGQGGAPAAARCWAGGPARADAGIPHRQRLGGAVGAVQVRRGCDGGDKAGEVLAARCRWCADAAVVANAMPKPLTEHSCPHPAQRLSIIALPRPVALVCSVLTEQPGLVGEAWWDWPAELRDRDPDALAK